MSTYHEGFNDATHRIMYLCDKEIERHSIKENGDKGLAILEFKLYLEQLLLKEDKTI